MSKFTKIKFVTESVKGVKSPLWHTTIFTRSEIQQVQSELKCTDEEIKVVCEKAAKLNIGLSHYAYSIKSLLDSQNNTTLYTSNKKESQMESWHTNLPTVEECDGDKKQVEKILGLIIERLKGQDYRLMSDRTISGALKSGRLFHCKIAEMGDIGGGDMKFGKLIPWDILLTKGVPSPEPDYSKWVGLPVFGWDSIDTKNYICFFKEYKHGLDYPFVTTSCNWKQCRLVTKEELQNWMDKL